MRTTILKGHIKKGFTIIEVLVVIVIIGMIMVAGSVRYREFSQRQLIVTMKRQILADIRSVQSDAATGRKPGGCNSEGYTLVGHAFEMTSTGGPSTPATYETYAICNDGSTDETFTTKAVSLPLGITLSMDTVPNPDVNPVIFMPLANGTNLRSNARVTITIDTGTNTDTIEIRAAGEIR